MLTDGNDADHDSDNAEEDAKADADDDDDAADQDLSDTDPEEGAMEAEGVVPPDVVAVETMDKNPVWIWHRKTGHLGLGNMRKLLKMSTGIDITDKQIVALLGADCPVCYTTRAVK